MLIVRYMNIYVNVFQKLDQSQLAESIAGKLQPAPVV